MFRYSLPVSYKLKRDIPNLTFFSPTSTSTGLISSGLIQSGSYVGGGRTNYAIALWTAEATSLTGLTLRSNDTTSVIQSVANTAEVITTYHFIADARIGIV